MNLRFFFMFMLSIMTLSVMGQRITDEGIDKESPKTGLEKAVKDYREALKTNNSQLIIESLVLQVKYQALIDDEKVPELYREMEARIKNAPIIEKSILHSILAEFYSSYYMRNSWKIQQRTALSGNVPEDITVWSGNIFMDTILSHALAAVEPAAVLSAADEEQYKTIIERGEDSKNFQHNLYDLLLNRSIETLTGINYSARRYATQLSLDDPKWMAPANDFIALDIDAKGMDINAWILQLYQRATRSRILLKQDAAFLITELDRIKFAYELSAYEDKDQYFLEALNKLNQQFRQSPYSVEAMTRLAGFYAKARPEREFRISPENKLKVLEICNEGIKRFPDYFRINQLKNLRDRMLKPSVFFNVEENVYPGENQQLRLRIENVSEISYTLNRINEDFVAFNTLSRSRLKREKIFSRKFTHRQKLEYRDTTLPFTVPSLGLYELILNAKEDKNKADTLYFSSSRLFAINRNGNNNYEVLVCDRMSGKPIEGAQVIFYRKEKGRYIETHQATSDAYGIASSTLSDKSQYYRIVHKNDHYTNFKYIPYYSSFSEDNEKDGINIFTDRRVYRPGQTVYFNAIAWSGDKNAPTALSGKKFTISLLDAQSREVSRKELTSNAFGSFSGSFTLPAEVLNGTFHLSINDNRTSFSVAEYVRPKFEIAFLPLNISYKLGDRITFNGVANYFTGVKLDNATVHYSITHNAKFSGKDMPEITGVTQTNQNGEFSISFDTQKTAATNLLRYSFYTYTVKATITAANGETQESTVNLNITDQSYQLMAEMGSNINKAVRTTVGINAFNANGDALSKDITYRIKQLKPLANIGDQYDMDNLPVVKTMEEGNCRSGSSELSFDFSGWTSGAYLFSMEDEDEKVNNNTIFYLYADNDKQPPLKTYNWLIQKKTDFSETSDAEILFGTSAQDVYVFYELSTPNKNLIERKLLTFSDENRLLKIPYHKVYGNGVDLILTFIKNGRVFQNVLRLRKKETQRELEILPTAFRDNLQPGQKEKWTFTIKQANKESIYAELMAGMYDASLDKITPHQWFFQPGFLNRFATSSWSQSSSLGNKHSGYLPFSYIYLDVPDFRFDQIKRLGTDVSEVILLRGNVNSVTLELSDNVVVTGSFSAKASLDPSYKYGGSANDEASPSVAVRKNFQETAFFYPQLLTDSLGQVNISFTVPEVNTAWKFMALAHTSDMAYGQLIKEVITKKDFMITPNLPRFIRNGDKVNIQTVINNLSDKNQNGDIYLELFTPENEKIIHREKLTFQVQAGENETVQFAFTTPTGYELLGCRIVASSENFSDGEQHLLPVVSDKALITQTTPFFITKKGEKKIRVNPPKGIEAYRLTLELTANPVWYAVMALPSVQTTIPNNITGIISNYYVSTVAPAIANANPTIANAIRNWSGQTGDTPVSPLEQNEELKSIVLQLTPWLNDAQDQNEQLRSLANLLDNNKQQYIQQQMLSKLEELQNQDGGWGWIKGFGSSRFITENVLEAMARITHSGAGEHDGRTKRLQARALNYLDRAIERDFNDSIQPGYTQLRYLYTRSAYRDIPLTNALQAHKHYIAWAEQSWRNFSLYEKGLAALTLYRYGFTESAGQILNSLREYATTTEDKGMYWANNRSLYFTNSAIQTHVMLMSAFYEIEKNTADTDLMKQWLITQKQTRNWGSIPSTVDAIHALLLTGKDLLSANEEIRVQWGKKELSTQKGELLTGYIKESYTGKEITPRLETVNVTKKENTPSWGGLYYQYFQALSQVTEQSGGISVEKELFVVRKGEKGNVLLPLYKDGGQETLNTGDKITVRIVVRNDQDMEFVHLKDLRAGCFEPTEQLSSTKAQGGVFFYQEINDASTNLFFQFLPKGTHVFEYSVWIARGGSYQDGISTLQCIYAPQYSANSKAGRIEVNE